MSCTNAQPADGLEGLTARILDHLNRADEDRDTMKSILSEIKDFTGFQAVGLRLIDGDDFPYYVTHGFPDEFVDAETSLCSRDKEGKILRDSSGRPLLDCMCGTIIRGEIDPEQTFFTKGGSFWSNCTTELLASSTEEDLQGRTRNRCNEGYESVALIPLRSGSRRVGLLQFNDRRRDRFTSEFIELFERLGTSIGIALAQRQARLKLARQAVELQSSNKELQQFAYIASHDLQEPLRMISYFTRLLDGKLRGKQDEETDDALEFIVDAAERMQRLVRDLLNFSRVGTKPKMAEKVDMEDVVNRAATNLALSVRESGACLSVESLPTVLADETQLIQLLQNLISNAIKFRGDEAPRIRIAAERLEDDWVFSVADNGVGIPPKHLDSVFEIFRRLHANSQVPGAGIGLATCKRIVERHGGRIWVESEAAAGSTFKFALPVD